MTAQQIQKKIEEKFDTFLRQVFPSPLPVWFLAPLPKAIMTLPQSAVPYHAKRILQILSKKPEELSIFEVGVSINILLAVRPEIFEVSIEEFLLRRIDLEGVRAVYTELTDKEKARLQKEKTALENMKGQRQPNNMTPV